MNQLNYYFSILSMSLTLLYFTNDRFDSSRNVFNPWVRILQILSKSINRFGWCQRSAGTQLYFLHPTLSRCKDMKKRSSSHKITQIVYGRWTLMQTNNSCSHPNAALPAWTLFWFVMVFYAVTPVWERDLCFWVFASMFASCKKSYIKSKCWYCFCLFFSNLDKKVTESRGIYADDAQTLVCIKFRLTRVTVATIRYKLWNSAGGWRGGIFRYNDKFGGFKIFTSNCYVFYPVNQCCGSGSYLVLRYVFDV